MALYNLKLFNYYRRFKWTAQNFTDLQNSLLGYPQTMLAAIAQNAVLTGLNQNGSSGLTVNYLLGTAINSSGALLNVATNGSVSVTNNVKSLIVVRPSTANTNVMSRPTAPFDAVYLNTEQTASVVAIAGTISAYPAVVSGDVILFGVTASSGAITQFDETQCQLIGKSAELNSSYKFNKLVGTTRECHYRDLATAIAAASTGDRIRVRASQVLNATIVISVSDILIEFDPNVTFSKGTAGIGFTLSGNGIKMINGRFTGFTTNAIAITGNYCMIQGARFATNTSDYGDSAATSTFVGVINE